MKKDLIFAPILLVVGILLCLFRVTDIIPHIIISVVGVVALVVYAILTKKEWTSPALEITMRAFYAVALISGIVINFTYIFALAIVHKVTAGLFIVALVILLIHKYEKSRAKK